MLAQPRCRAQVAVIAGAGGAKGTAVPAAFAREGARLLLVDTRYVAAGKHVMSPSVESGDGEPVRGDAFPVVWRRE